MKVFFVICSESKQNKPQTFIDFVQSQQSKFKVVFLEDISPSPPRSSIQDSIEFPSVVPSCASSISKDHLGKVMEVERVKIKLFTVAGFQMNPTTLHPDSVQVHHVAENAILSFLTLRSFFLMPLFAARVSL
jgi:hypothetical protein